MEASLCKTNSEKDYFGGIINLIEQFKENAKSYLNIILFTKNHKKKNL